MATPQQLANLRTAYAASLAAAQAQSPWHLAISPHEYAQAAACEAIAETLWLTVMPTGSHNCLGIKVFKGWSGHAVVAPGTEQNPNGSWTGPQADLWCVFPSYQACFAQQLIILQESRYLPAVNASTVEGYISRECAIWSTGQAKGQLVVSIYEAHKDVLV